MKEKWKPVAGYEGLYEVSDQGRVRSLKFGKTKELSPGITGAGYYQVHLCKDGKIKRFSVHRLVVSAFIGPIPLGMVVNHINENKLDNRLSNLEICTYKQNSNHGSHKERVGKANSKSLIGNTNRAMQLKLTNAKTCAKYTFSSSYEASAFFGYNSKLVVGCYIHRARQRGENFINIRDEKHYFHQEA